MTATIVGASPEVIEHHAKLHARGCLFGKASIVPCGCGLSHAINCSQCGGVVFYAVAPRSWCEHIAGAVGRG
jgi:hypothetical protein